MEALLIWITGLMNDNTGPEAVAPSEAVAPFPAFSTALGWAQSGDSSLVHLGLHTLLNSPEDELLSSLCTIPPSGSSVPKELA